MQTTIQEFLKDKRLPKFLIQNKKLNSFTKVSKVFPSIGLANCKENIKYDNSLIAETTALDLVNQITYSLFIQINDKLSELNVGDKRDKIVYWHDIAYKLRKIYCKSYIVKNQSGGISLKLPNDILDKNNKVIFKAREGLFKVYNKICEINRIEGIGARYPKLENFELFKQFSTENVPHKNYQIVFSSNGNEGLWDIATMSMRGIKSCQSWSGRFKTQLVGSLVDPCVGIIYLTSGKDVKGLGSKMIKRSIVRYVINSETKKPTIIIDKSYPAQDPETIKIFRDFIAKRTENKIEILAYPYDNVPYTILNKLYLPSTKIQKKLTRRTKSYMDTILLDKDKIQSNSALEINIRNRQTRLRNLVNRSCDSFDMIKTIDVKTISKNKNMIESIRTILKSPDINGLLREHYPRISNDIINDVSINDVEYSDEYMKRLLFAFLARKHFKKNVSILVRKINSYFRFEKNKRINSKIVNQLLMPIDKHLFLLAKSGLKELIVVDKSKKLDEPANNS